MSSDKQSWLRRAVSAHIGLVQQMEDEVEGFVERFAAECAAAFLRGNRLWIAGNGGSAADAQHMASEFTGRFEMDRPALPAVALTTDSSALTAIGNDYSFTEIFSRQVEGLAAEQDLLLLISTSGNSGNILAAAEAGRKRNVQVWALTGRDGGRLRDAADDILVVPGAVTARIQEVHLLVEHLICEAVERRLFPVAKD